MATPRGYGLTCPTCVVKLRVTDTKRPCRGRVVRYRKCPQCGYKAVTVEQRASKNPLVS